MALSQDILTRIVNVHWGGGAIVAVGVEVADDENTIGRIYRGKPSEDTANILPQTWTTVVETKAVAFRCMSYALVNGTPTTVGESIIEVGGTPVFLAGGGASSSIEMRYSNNAQQWSNVFTKPYDNVGAYGLMGIVWDPDERAFFAASAATIDSGDILAQRQLWSSSDGRSWNLVAELISFSSEQTDEIDKQITQLLLAHATKPENRGGKDGKVPDGFQAYDPNKKIFMTPGGLTGWKISGPILDIGNTVKIESKADDGKVTNSSASFPVEIVWGVSFAGGVWNVLGMRELSAPTFQKPSVVFCSTDDGETWEEVFARAGYFPAGIVSGDI